MRYLFNGFEIDTLQFKLHAAGKTLAIEPKVFDLLVYLIKNRQRTVTRDELFDSVWQGQVVCDTTLSNHIRTARKILGDDGNTQKVIKTIHGRGYQFIASVTEHSTISKDKSKINLNGVFIVLICLTILTVGGSQLISFNNNESDVESNKTYLIAVLPFSNTKPNKETDYFGFAIADRVISELAYQKNVNVRSSSSVRKYSSSILNHQQVGDELNVDYLIVGNYLNVNNKIRVSIELIQAKNNELIWRSKNIEVVNDNAFQIQDMVAQKVLAGLQLKLNSSEEKKVIKNLPTNPKAFELYLKSIAQPFSSVGHKQAITFLKQSIDLDENYAPAYVQLGNRIRRLEQYGLINTGESHDTLRYYQKALSLNGTLLSALSHLAFVYTETNRIDEAMELVLKMVDINPSNAQTRFTLGYILRYAGHPIQAIKEMEMAVQLDPKNIRFRSIVATYSGLAEFDKALLQLSSYPESVFTIGWQGLLNLRLGQQDKALNYFNILIESDSDGLWGLVAKVHRAYLNGDINEGLVAVHQLEQTNIADSETVYYTAVYYCMLGDTKRCLQSYRKAVDGGYYNYTFIDKSPYWEQVKYSPEFLAIYQKAKEKSDAFKLKYLTPNTDEL